MASGGAVWAKRMIEEARETEGISERTLRRAKDELGLAASKDKTPSGNGAWYSGLAGQPHAATQGGQLIPLASGSLGHLPPCVYTRLYTQTRIVL